MAQLPRVIRDAFEIYQSGESIYFVSATKETIIGIKPDEIDAIINDFSTATIITKNGRVVLFKTGDSISQFFNN